MVWILAILCLALVGAAGYYQGPVRGSFTFFGLLFGTTLAGPLSPLTRQLLPLVGLHHPAWNIFAPQVMACLLVLLIFKIAGHVVHAKIAMHFKYKVTDQTLYRWQRIYSRLGLCVGLLNGAVYFILLSLLIYSAGYFTTEAATGPSDPAGAKFLTEVRSELHAQNLDRVLASYDMVPAPVYQAADIATLVVHNPLLLSRLGHYPPCLELGQRQEYRNLAHDVQFLQMITTQQELLNVVEYPRFHAMLTNGSIVSEVSHLIGNDLEDLQTFLNTGQSPKYDPEIILGVWDINRVESMALVRKKDPGITPKRLGQVEQELFPRITGLSLTAMPDGKLVLARPNPSTSENTVVAAGTWKKEQDSYQVNLPGSVPETAEIEIVEAKRLLLPNFGYVLAFDKEL